MSQDRNGADTLTHFEARLRELELAIGALTNALADEWRPRLLAMERDIDALRELLRAAHNKEE